MLKRKRDYGDNGGDHVPQMRKKGVAEQLSQSKKLLHRALKTAKGFERQKLGKRLKLAKEKGDKDEVRRLQREVEALKGLDLDKATAAHLHRTLLKSKAIADSELLPEDVRTVLPKPEGSEEEVLALHNVTSGMYNMPVVKDAMVPIVNGICLALGIPAPTGKTRLGKKEQVEDILKGQPLHEPREVDVVESSPVEDARDAVAEPIWDGFDSGAEDMNQELDGEDFAQYDSLIAGSSDEEILNDEDDNCKRPSSYRTTKILNDLSVSRSQPPSTSELPPRLKQSSVSMSKVKSSAKPGGSTFLPTLMGGYWSGSESSASDLDEDGIGIAPPKKKNRRGQVARRAIWEKKYGMKANHIKKGLDVVGKGRDDGWDARKGAKESRDHGRVAPRRAGIGTHGDRRRNFEHVTGDNAIPVQPRPRGMGKRDDVGVLHPSWQAAKKAREMKKTAAFQGKKVTFD